MRSFILNDLNSCLTFPCFDLGWTFLICGSELFKNRLRGQRVRVTRGWPLVWFPKRWWLWLWGAGCPKVPRCAPVHGLLPDPVGRSLKWSDHQDDSPQLAVINNCAWREPVAPTSSLKTEPSRIRSNSYLQVTHLGLLVSDIWNEGKAVGEEARLG